MVLIAALLGLLVWMFKDNAIGSIKIPEGVLVLPGNLPVIGEHHA
jgi:hypothetical protein